MRLQDRANLFGKELVGCGPSCLARKVLQSLKRALQDRMANKVRISPEVQWPRFVCRLLKRQDLISDLLLAESYQRTS